MAAQSGGRWIKWGIVLLLLAAGGWFGWKYWKSPRNTLPEYRTAQIARGDIVQTVTASGQLNPMLSVQVGSQVSGIIQNLYADFNTTVTQGMVVAKLDPATYLSAVHQAEGELANAKAGLDLTKIEAKRAEELKNEKLIASADYDKAMADFHQAEAQVMIRDAALERAKVDLNRCTIFAPTNGIVISRQVDVGQTVAASFSAPVLFVIANDLRKMQIDAMVSEADVGGVETNQEVRFTVDAFPTRNFTGKVVQIRNAPTTNQNVVTYDSIVEVSNDQLKLKPGMTATVTIILAEKDNVIKVPNAAFRFRPADTSEKSPSPAAAQGASDSTGPPGQRTGGGANGGGGGRKPGGGGGGAGRQGGKPKEDRSPVRTVYVLPNGGQNGPDLKPEPRKVRVGISDGAFSEVLEGLQEGDTVVVGQNTPVAGPSAAPANPFGGGGGRRF
ncbi:MAG: Efflux transporter, family, subunit [Verrucomicrobiales bacterium]|nr:Efflux transporter, family, subunit [Verrucomicrobiales bacterium]